MKKDIQPRSQESVVRRTIETLGNWLARTAGIQVDPPSNEELSLHELGQVATRVQEIKTNNEHN